MRTVFFRLIIAIAVIGLFSLYSNSVHAQTLVSDQADYMAGTTVTLIGTGFLENEQVIIDVNHVDVKDQDGDLAHVHHAANQVMPHSVLSPLELYQVLHGLRVEDLELFTLRND